MDSNATSATAALRARLSSDLASLPGSSKLACHILTTSPRKCTTLFPHTSLPAKKRAQVTEQDYLILLSQGPLDAGGGPGSPATSLVSAAEIVVYTFANSQASIIYISKIDSTGQVVPNSGSPTGILVKSLLRFFSNAETRPSPSVRIQLFARAQGQYLFPDSSLFAGKRVLRDVELCRWWKDVLTYTVVGQQQLPSDTTKWQCYYLFPGLSEAEAQSMLKNVKGSASLSGAVEWVYGHPYTLSNSLSFSTLLEGPSATASSSSPLSSSTSSASPTPIDIFDFVPTFSDDPKARFLVELAVETNAEGGLLKPPASKRHKPSHPSATSDSQSQNKDNADENSNNPPPPAPSKKRATVSIEEFWERMGFREECNLSAVTGFFVVDSVAQPAASRPPHSTTSLSPSPSTDAPLPGYITPPMLSRVTAQLMNIDFGSTERARQSTALLTDSIKGLCSGLGSTTGPSHAAPNDDYYEKHVLLTVECRNPPPAARTPSSTAENGASAAPAVNVLQVRKKKRPAAT